MSRIHASLSHFAEIGISLPIAAADRMILGGADARPVLTDPHLTALSAGIIVHGAIRQWIGAALAGITTTGLPIAHQNGLSRFNGRSRCHGDAQAH